MVGYSTQGRSRAGLEQSENSYLTASDANLGTIFDKLGDSLHGTTITGNNVVLNIQAGPQKLAEIAARGEVRRRGGDEPEDRRGLRDGVDADVQPEQDRVQLGVRPDPEDALGVPGLLVGAAQPGDPGPLPSGLDLQDRHGGCRDGRRDLRPRLAVLRPGLLHRVRQEGANAENPDQNGPEAYGHVNLLEAYEHSINAVFCNIGKKIGAGLILDKAKDFGFYSKPPIELPSDEVAPSGLYNLATHSLYDNPALVDPGRLAFGQEHLLTTPLQMALVAAGVANGGVVMTPHLVKEVLTPGGSVVFKSQPKVWKQALKPKTAAELN